MPQIAVRLIGGRRNSSQNCYLFGLKTRNWEENTYHHRHLLVEVEVAEEDGHHDDHDDHHHSRELKILNDVREKELFYSRAELISSSTRLIIAITAARIITEFLILKQKYLWSCNVSRFSLAPRDYTSQWFSERYMLFCRC